MAAQGIELSTLSLLFSIPRGTLGRWAHEQSWPVVQKRNQRLGLPQLYDAKHAHRAILARQQRSQRRPEAA